MAIENIKIIKRGLGKCPQIKNSLCSLCSLWLKNLKGKLMAIENIEIIKKFRAASQRGLGKRPRIQKISMFFMFFMANKI